MRRLPALLFVLCLLLTAPGCGTLPAQRAWAAADLRLLDPLDAPTPSTELLAVYVRSVGSDLEIRLDLLDLPLVPDADLGLRLVTPTGELVVSLPAEGRPSISPEGSGLRVRLVRDPWLDTVTVRLNRLGVSQPFALQAFSSLPGQASIADETGLVRSDTLPPTPRAPVVVAFWDVYPAYSPAQALRRWDGAHTGPTGERHGLKHTLDSVETYHLPIALLDLKTPASLAALNFEGALPQAQRLAADGLLLLPEAAYSQPLEAGLEFSRRAAQGFDLPGSSFVYAAGGELIHGYSAQFIPLPDGSHLAHAGGTRLIPLPATEPAQATDEGPSLEVRRALVQALFSADRSDLVALGGSLSASTWGDSDMAYPTFAWLAGHPWIRVLGGYDLLAFPARLRYEPPPPAAPVADVWLESLRRAPENAAARSAWQAYLQLHAPTGDARLLELRRVYAGQVGLLLAAADWAESPAPLADCSRDPDQDGRAECLLANGDYFAVIETNGARLTHLFFLNQSGPHQLVAPTVQFETGAGDPSQWRPERGDAADPRAVMGAFSDSAGTFDEYVVTEAGAGLLVLTSESGRVKTFRLAETGLEVAYQDAGPVSANLPLAVDPQRFYAGPSEYRADYLPGSSWTWGPAGGTRVEVRTDAYLSAEGFTVSRPFLGRPENPNLQFPDGHYFPFPFSMVTVRGEGAFTVWVAGK